MTFDPCKSLVQRPKAGNESTNKDPQRPERMDEKYKKKLEQARTRTPRYLFRVWNNTPGIGSRVSGGQEGLNTMEAITPLAFYRGRGEPIVYHLTKARFSDMALAHLDGRREPETELSSWTASIRYALNRVVCQLIGFHEVAGDESASICEHLYVSMIDVRELEDKVQIFHVPLLACLDTGIENYDHEYLARGVIEGPAHKAVPLKAFLETGIRLDRTEVLMNTHRSECIAISPLDIHMARAVALKYGGIFALPMMLALICRELRDLLLFREGVENFHIVLRGIEGLEVPHGWGEELSIMEDVVYTENFGEVEQFVRLMRALVQHWVERGE